MALKKNDLDDRETLDWLENATLDGHPYLAPDPDAPLRKAADFPNLATDDLKDDVLALPGDWSRSAGWRCWFWTRPVPNWGSRWSR